MFANTVFSKVSYNGWAFGIEDPTELGWLVRLLGSKIPPSWVVFFNVDGHFLLSLLSHFPSLSFIFNTNHGNSNDDPQKHRTGA